MSKLEDKLAASVRRGQNAEAATPVRKPPRKRAASTRGGVAPGTVSQEASPELPDSGLSPSPAGDPVTSAVPPERPALADTRAQHPCRVWPD